MYFIFPVVPIYEFVNKTITIAALNYLIQWTVKLHMTLPV